MSMPPMSMPLLPYWLAWVVAAVLAGVVVLHVWHAAVMHGQPRWWHIGHVLMAVGMIAMYLVPQDDHAGMYWGGVVLFGVVAVTMTAIAARWWHEERLLNWLWAASTVDMFVMAYMSLPATDRDVVLTSLAVAYLAVELVIWLSDPLPRLRALLRSHAPARQHPAQPLQAGMTAVRAHPVEAETESVRLVADVTGAVRVTLAVMSGAMIWMLIAMQTMTMSPALGGMMPMGS